LAHWALIPRPVSPLCDRIFWSYCREVVAQGRLTHAHSIHPTVNFRSRYAAHYRKAGLEPPPGSKDALNIPPAIYSLPWPFEQEIAVDAP
jgi:hypothetical protein